jgi:hypothetical protein
MEREKIACAAIAFIAAAGSAFAGSEPLPSPYGSIEFRWRERAVGVVPTVGGQQRTTLSPTATGFSGSALNAVSNATVTNDARFVLVLEARVTRAGGNSDLGGLNGFAFNLVSSDSSGQGRFAATTANDGSLRNAASASASVYNQIGAYSPLPSGASQLPGTDGLGDRGQFGPFRRVADLGGKNQPAIGIQNLTSSVVATPYFGKATLENVTVGASTDPLTFVDPDTNENGPYFGRNDFYGLDTWVPVFTAVYNIADVATQRDIVITADISGDSPIDSGIRGFRGFNNALGVDSWEIDNAGLPSFVISIPTPGATALLGLGGLVAARRRRA